MHPTLAKLLLAPVLLGQGWSVRRNIIRLPEPPGDRAGVTGQGPALRIGILGDSAAAGVGADNQSQALSGQLVDRLSRHHKVHWRLIAQSGETTASFSEMLKQHPSTELDIVLISLGVNDVTSGLSQKAYAQHTRQLIQRIRTQFSSPRIIFSGLPPMGQFPALPNPLRWFLGLNSNLLDATLEALTQQQGCEYIKAYMDADRSFAARDGFHPGPKAYEKWAEMVASRILVSMPEEAKAN